MNEQLSGHFDALEADTGQSFGGADEIAVSSSGWRGDKSGTAAGYRDRHLEGADVLPRELSSVLHVGCGVDARGKLPPVFRGAEWREIRLDIDPEVLPDFVATITDMGVIADEAVDAVYSSHNLEHLYPHEVPLALREMHRVLKPSGFAFIKLPDLQEVARYVAEGLLEDPLYESPVGPIAPLDVLFGHRPSLAAGNVFMAHRTGFTRDTLGAALIKAGFAAAMLQGDPSAFCLDAIAFRTRPGNDQVTKAQARMLPAPDRPAVMYTPLG